MPYRAHAHKRSATRSRTRQLAWPLGFTRSSQEWTDTDGEPERELTKDEMLDDITLYWLTNTAASSARIYWEDNADKTKAAGEVSIPAAVSRVPARDNPLTAQLGRARLPQPRVLQRTQKGRSLRRLGTTGSLCGRDASGVQVAPLIGAASRMVSTWPADGDRLA